MIQIVKEKRGRDVKTDPDPDQPPEKLQFLSRTDDDYIEGNLVSKKNSFRIYF